MNRIESKDTLKKLSRREMRGLSGGGKIETISRQFKSGWWTYSVANGTWTNDQTGTVVNGYYSLRDY